MSTLVRQAVLLGNSVHRIDVQRRSGDIRLLPVADYSITGSPAPETWRYAIKQARPNGDDPLDIEQLPVTVVPYEGMVHVRYMPGPQAPWHGVSPLVSAGVTAGTLAEIEKSLSHDASVPTGGLMPQPDAASPTAIRQAGAAFTQGKGGLTLIETTAGGYGQGPSAAPRQDWDQKRFGAYAARGQHQALGGRDEGGNGIARRQPLALHVPGLSAARELPAPFSGTIVPLGQLIAAELSEKLERDITIAFPERVETDISALSRAFKSLAEQDPAWAAEVVGLPEPPERVVELDDEVEQVVPAPENQNGHNAKE